MIEIVKPRHLQVAGSSQPRFVTVRREGALFDLGGDGFIEIFRVGVLAEAVDRSRDRVLEWEKSRLIPPPLFQVHGERWRYYSAAQLVCVNRLAIARFAGRRYVPSMTMDMFFDEVWKTWFVGEVIVDNSGEVDGSRATRLRRPPAAPPKPRAARIAW
jgi:hypothetical protein